MEVNLGWVKVVKVDVDNFFLFARVLFGLVRCLRVLKGGKLTEEEPSESCAFSCTTSSSSLRFFSASVTAIVAFVVCICDDVEIKKNFQKKKIVSPKSAVSKFRSFSWF